MQEIITVNGQQYSIETIAPLTQEQRNEVIRQLGRNRTNSIVSIGTGTCSPTPPIIRGSTRTVRCIASAGNGTYNYSLNVVGATGSPFTFGPTTETTHDFSVPFPNTATTDITLTVSDTCVGGTPDTAICTATLVAATVTNFTVTPSSCTAQIGGTPCSLTAANCTDQSGGAMTCTTATWSAISGTGSVTFTPSGLTCSVSGATVGTATIRCVIGTKTVDIPIIVTTTVCPSPTCGFTVV